MNLQQRLTKLEGRTPERQPVVVWMNPGETQEEACRRAGFDLGYGIVFVTWALDT